MKLATILLYLIQTEVKSAYFDRCASNEWIEEIVWKQEDDANSCTVANARLFAPCSMMIGQLSKLKHDSAQMYHQEWYRMLTPHSKNQVNDFVETKLTMLARSISALQCKMIKHQVLSYYPHISIMAALDLSEDTVLTDILNFSHMGLNEKVSNEENLTKIQQRKIGLRFDWPDAFEDRGTTKFWVQFKDEGSHFIYEHDRQRRSAGEPTKRARRDADNKDSGKTLIDLNALSNLEDTLRSLQDDINSARNDIKESVNRDEIKLNVLEADLATEIGGRIDEGFKDQNLLNDERMKDFEPANSTVLVAIIIIQTLTIIGMAYLMYKKADTNIPINC